MHAVQQRVRVAGLPGVGILALACLAVLVACAAPSTRKHAGSSAAPSPVHGGATAVAVEGLWTDDGNAIYIRYQVGGSDHYAVADRFHEQNVAPHGDWESVVYAAPTREAAFAKAADQARPLTVLQQTHYRGFILGLAEQLLPPDDTSGILLNRADKEFFFYRDATGRTVMVEGMVNKPPHIRLAASYRVEMMGGRIAREGDRYLSDMGVEGDTILLSTGETGPYARPFAIFERSTGRRVFVSLEPFRFGAVKVNALEQAGKTAWNAGRSYWWDFWNRPVSHVARGVFYALDTVRDTGQELTIKVFQLPELANKPVPPVSDGPGMDLEEWEAYLDATFGTQAHGGQARLLIGGDQFFPRLVDAIQNAHKSVNIRTYILDNDDFALSIADLLRERSREAKVRVMLDSLGTQFAQAESPATLPEGTQPPPPITHYLEMGSKVNVRALTNPWLAGDHTKTMSVDGEVAYVGGMNIGREYRWEWHDLMVELTGPVVEAIDYEFDKAWAHATIAGDVVYPAFRATARPDGRPARAADYPIRLLATRPTESQILWAQVDAIRRAKRYAWVENAYFASTRIMYELAKARHRGVDVRVVMPVEGDAGIMNKSNVIAANTLLEHGVRVYIYPGMSHVKAAIYDGWACLGSANFDKLSLRVNRELNVGISHPGFVEQLRRDVFEADMANSVELTEPLSEDLSNTLASIIASQL
jgi:cardiolipin synthase